MSDHATRRTFLKHSAAVVTAAFAAPAIIPASALGKDGAVSPSERVTLGVIGIGPRCTYDLTAMLTFPDVRCVAIADVQQSRREAGKKLVDKTYGDTSCQLYSDLRELLDRKDIDTVIVATGDRWHAPGSMLAAEAGKDVYSEKPCGISIRKCQELADTIHRTGRVFQAGTQRRSVPHYRHAVELAQTGKLGKIHTLHASIYRPVLDNQWLPGEPTPTKDVCDWNLWLGPAPWRPYHSSYVQGKWRGYWDFDSGAKLLDWGVHTMDLCQFANQSDDTVPVEYIPAENEITCLYANGVKLVIDFLNDPFGERAPHYITRLGTCPVRFVGDEGSAEVGDNPEVVTTNPALAMAAEQRVRYSDVQAHARNFFDCVKTHEKTACNAEVMSRSHIAAHAASIAWILGRPLKFDPVKEVFVNDSEANLLTSRPERDFWNS